MSVAGLNAALDTAYARIRAPSGQRTRDPYAAMLNQPYYNDDSAVRSEGLLAKYQGRFYAAANVIVKRIAMRPIYCASKKPTRSRRSLKNLVRKGMMPHESIPDWICDHDSLEMLDVHPLMTAMQNPNRLMTSFNLWEMVIASLLVTGRGFLVALPSEDENRAFDLFSIPATWMTPVHTDKRLFAQWQIKPPDSMETPITVDGSQVSQFYFADPSNPACAISPLAMVASSVLADGAISQAQVAEFRNGSIPRVALIAGDVTQETSFTDNESRVGTARPVRLEPWQRRQIITWFQQQYAGPAKAGLPIVLDALIRDVKILSRTPKEMAFLESSALTKEQINEALGVSDILLGNLKSANRATGSLAEQFFADNVLNPIITLVSQALTKTMGPLFSVGGEQLLAWIAPVIPKDPEVELEYWRLGVRGYAILRNDLRRRVGLEPVEGMDDVVMPERLETREADDDRVGVGRLPFEPGNEPPPQNQVPFGQRMFSLNGKH